MCVTALALTTIAAVSVSGCRLETNACVGVGPDPSLDTCFQDENTAASCDGLNVERVSGDSWTFHDGSHCKDEGFDFQCPNDAYKLAYRYCDP